VTAPARLSAPPAPNGASARARPTRAHAALAAIVGLVALVAVFASDEDGPVLCPWRRCTGISCPGCGLTRAAGRLVRGDLAGAWYHHPFAVLGALQLAAAGAVHLARPGVVPRWAARRLLPLVVANLALLVGIWVVRLATGAVPGFGG
jgi:hypothetical protein